MDMVKLTLKGVSTIMGFDDGALISLVNEDETRQLSITCEKRMAAELVRRLSHRSDTRSLLPEVLCRMMGINLADEASHYRLIIYSIVEGQYKVLFINEKTGDNEELRASDAVLLSLVSAIPLYASQQVFNLQSTPYTSGSHDLSLPVNSLTDQMLHSALKKAVDSEQYEVASHLRDEIRRREGDAHKRT